MRGLSILHMPTYTWISASAFHEAESLGGVILLVQGQIQQANAVLGNVLVRQQDCIGDNHFDTLETQGPLAMAAQAAGRRQDAFARLKRRSEIVATLLWKKTMDVSSTRSWIWSK